MHSETPFRLAVVIVFVVSLAISGYFRYQARRPGEEISRQGEGRLLFLAIRLGGLALFLATLLYLIRPAWLAWASIPLPGAIRWLGAVLGAGALVVLYWTLNSLGGNLTDTVVTRAQHTLVVGGPYRWIRHPFYISFLLLVGAVSLLASNALLAVIGIVVFALLAIRTPIEEQNLEERFGEEYRQYKLRTGRFLPKVRR